MFYFKKVSEGITQYHACSKMPPFIDDMTPITQEEYEAALAELFEAEEVI